MTPQQLPDLLVLALAVWRLASLFASEEGPGDLFGRFRAWAGVRYDPNGIPVGSSSLARGMVCIWCQSVWWAVLLTVIYAFWPGVAWLCLPLALSAAAILVEKGAR